MSDSPSSRRRGRPPSPEKGAAILEAATASFLHEGYAGTSLDAVAAAAGVSKQTVYSRFGDKERLFRAVVEAARSADGPPKVLPDLAGAPDLRAALEAFALRHQEITQRPRIAALRRLMIAELARRPALREQWDAGEPAAAFAHLERQFALLHEQGRLDVPDPMRAARHLIAILSHEGAMRSLYGVRPMATDERRELALEAVDTFLRAWGRGSRMMGWMVHGADARRSVAAMAKVYDGIDARMAAWIEAQPLFFVATAPLASDGLVNMSPKGTRGTFRVLDEHTFSYLDLTGSGIETVAHLRENGRICVMFCAFDGGPKIVRLHGAGRVVLAGDPGFDAAVAPFGDAAQSRRPQSRAVIVVDVTRVADACGYTVPRMDLVEERGILDAWAETRGPAKLARYRAERNATSLDGLPGLPGVPEPATR